MADEPTIRETLQAYADGSISRYTAMAALGLTHYTELAGLMGKHGIACGPRGDASALAQRLRVAYD